MVMLDQILEYYDARLTWSRPAGTAHVILLHYVKGVASELTQAVVEYWASSEPAVGIALPYASFRD